MKFRWSQLPDLIFSGATLAYFAAIMVFWPLSEQDWQRLEENSVSFLALATATTIFATMRRSLVKRYRDPWYMPTYLRFSPHAVWFLIIIVTVFIFRFHHGELPFFPDIEVTVIRIERVPEIWFAESEANSKPYIAGAGQKYLLVEVKLASVNGAENIAYRYFYFLKSGRVEIEEAHLPLKDFARPDRTSCYNQVHKKVPQNGSVACWVAFKIPDTLTSGHIEFNNYQVFDRSPRFQF